MSTHALTKVIDKEKVILAMYTHWDGYPSFYGELLYNFLNDFNIVNGVSDNQKGNIANGMGCLAAQIVAHFKEAPGNIYLLPVDAEDEEYTYIVTLNKATNKLEVEVNGINYSLEDFKIMCEDDN